MNSDERILKALEDLKAGQKSLQTDVASIKDVQQKQGERLEALEAGQKNLESGQKSLQANVNSLQADVSSIKDIQQKQNNRLETLEAGQKELNTKVDNVELKVEAIHEYQQKAHAEMMGIMTDISEINGREQKKLEKRVERIEEHLELPPMK